MFLIILLTCSLIDAAKPDCREGKRRTSYFISHHNNRQHNSLNNSFYRPETAFKDGDECEPMKNSRFRKLVNATKSYDTEHIVDLANSILPECNKQIRGNMILAIGTWNRAVGQQCWEDAEAEKREVYGNQIVDNAIGAVKRCCKNQSLNAFEIVAIIGVVIILIGIFAVIIVVGKRNRSVEQQIYSENMQSLGQEVHTDEMTQSSVIEQEFNEGLDEISTSDPDN